MTDLDYQEDFLCCDGDKKLAQAAQRICGRPIPVKAQGQVGWGSEHSGLWKVLLPIAGMLGQADL